MIWLALQYVVRGLSMNNNILKTLSVNLKHNNNNISNMTLREPSLADASDHNAYDFDMTADTRMTSQNSADSNSMVSRFELGLLSLSR